MKLVRLLGATLALAAFSVFGFAQAPLTSTLADLNCTKMTSYLKSNLPVAPVVNIPAFDPQNSAAYIKALNLNQAVAEVYGGTGPDPIQGDNQVVFFAYSNTCHEWEEHRDTNPIPNFPATLKRVDLGGFDAWWAAYNLRFDQTSVWYGDDDYTGMLARKQAFKMLVAPLPSVVILPATAAAPPLQASGNPVGDKLPGSPFFKLAASGYSVGDKDPSQKFILINPSPMNSDPTKFVWAPAN